MTKKQTAKSLLQRINDKIIVTSTGCHEWTGYKHDGYGRVSVNGKPRAAHRALFEYINGPLDSKMKVCHSCDNTACVNIYHLFAGTQKQNIEDCSAKGRIAGKKLTHCKRGHEFSAKNTHYRKARNQRVCLVCSREKKRETRIKQGKTLRPERHKTVTA